MLVKGGDTYLTLGPRIRSRLDAYFAFGFVQVPYLFLEVVGN